MNTKDIIEKVNTELTAKGFTSIKLSENNEWEETIDLNINYILNNKYGASFKQARYLRTFSNVGMWNEKGYKKLPIEAEDAMMMGVSKSSVSFIIDLAKKYEGINFNLVMNDMKK